MSDKEFEFWLSQIDDGLLNELSEERKNKILEYIHDGAIALKRIDEFFEALFK